MRDNLACGVVEPAISKIKSLRFATEAAITILRIGKWSLVCVASVRPITNPDNVESLGRYFYVLVTFSYSSIMPFCPFRLFLLVILMALCGANLCFPGFRFGHNHVCVAV